MNAPEPSRHDDRVLILAATSRDAVLTRDILAAAGIRGEVCSGFLDLQRRVREGAAAIVVAEEAVTMAHNTALRGFLSRQPPWSDLPVLVLTRSDSDEVDAAIRNLGNVTLLERPMRVATLVSTVRTAVRARKRQYQLRGFISERVRAEQALRIADQRKDEFLAMLGHELRNPLAPLANATQLLKLANLHDPVAVRVTDVMERQVGHLIRLVEDLLEVSRISRGIIDVRHEPLDLVSVVRAAIETSRPLLDAAGHALAVEVPAEPLVVAGDAVRLTQVFTNLLTNAARYTADGGSIVVSIAREGAEATVTVRDNGIGIPAAQLDSVFDMFTQVSRAERGAQGGLGIGLTLVRSLVTMHGGRVEARSNGNGTGSEFIVQLPVLEEEPPPPVRPLSPGRFAAQRILVVDDNEDAGDTLGELLAELGATVTVHHDGLTALETLDASAPDAVLLDLGMPGMDGYEVARRIRATPRHAGVLLIALTGWGQEDDRSRSREAGFDHHLVKPPDVNRLQELITAATNGAEAGGAI
jgi:signal transduction histidine kinase/ActR/RegA family two-component response regulator